MDFTLADLLDDEIFSELIEYTPDGSNVPVSITARVVRDWPVHMSNDGAGDKTEYVYPVKILNYEHPTFGGIVAPKVGQRFKISIRKGGALVDGWEGGAPRPFLDGWEIPVTFRARPANLGRRI